MFLFNATKLKIKKTAEMNSTDKYLYEVELKGTKTEDYRNFKILSDTPDLPDFNDFYPPRRIFGFTPCPFTIIEQLKYVMIYLRLR